MGINNATVQVIVIGFLAFCGPGMFNALNGLGAAGSGDPKAGSITNGSLYATFAIVGYFAGTIFNVLGPRWSFTLGGLSYAIYAICVYFGTVSLFLPGFGGFQLGIGAGIFWCAQMALCISYSTETNNSKLMSIFWAIFNLGGVAGGVLQMGLNWKLFTAEKGGIYTAAGNRAAPAAYFTFVAVMCCSPIIAWTLLASPSKVIKADGTAPKVKPAEPFKKEFMDAAKGFVDPFVLKMLICFIFSNWFYTYEFTFLNNYFFNSRFAGLNSALYWGAQMIGAVMVPPLTDNQNWSIKKRGRMGLYLNAGFLAISWIVAAVVTYTSCDALVDKDNGVVLERFPVAGVEKAMAWFPADSCDKYPEIRETWGTDSCNHGCDFLRLCRITKQTTVVEGNDAFATETATSNICDAYFPRCADDGAAREYKTGALTVSLPEEQEHERAKGQLDLISGSENVCSKKRYSTVGAQRYAIAETMDAATFCARINDQSSENSKPWTFPPTDAELNNYASYQTGGAFKTPDWHVEQAGKEAEKTSDCTIFSTICELNTDGNCVARGDGQEKIETLFPMSCLELPVNYISQSALIVVNMILMGISDAIFQVYILWLIGAAALGDLSVAARYSAAYKGIQSAGAAAAWLTDLIPSFTYEIQFYVCVVFAGISCIGAWFTISMLHESTGEVGEVAEHPQSSSTSSSDVEAPSKPASIASAASEKQETSSSSSDE